MLHDNAFEVLKQFLGNYTAEVYGRQLIGKIPLSHKAIALLLEELENHGVLKSRKQGSIKYYGLSLRNSEIRDFITVAELLRKIEFLSSNRVLASIFKSDDRIVGIFGSYAKGTQKKGSDVDVFVIGSKIKNDYGPKGIKFDLNISIKYFSGQQWKRLLIEKNNLVKEIIANHVLMFNAEKFVQSAWRHYYGFN